MSFLRHTVATLAYRSTKSIRTIRPELAEFKAASDSRSPLQILAHMSDLLDWAFSMAAGTPVFHDSTPGTWADETERYLRALRKFDEYLASGTLLHATEEKLFQGPIADALTHTGQLNLLGRLAGAPVRGENYFVADISIGSVGLEQATPRREFD